jgi:protein-S-isoprenylcysteine O-methyltransferase Ste14
MLGPLLALGGAAGVTLIGLLIWTSLDPDRGFWPPPSHWSWQSLLFWSLFRTLNIAALVLAALDWQPWHGLSLDRVAGGAVAILGGGLYVAACYALGRGNLYCGKDGLVTQGMYRWTRNPQYATAIPAYLGLALASHSLAAGVLAMLLALAFILMARAEEPWLESVYGQSYLDYRQEVARFYNWRHAVALARLELSKLERALKEARP